MVKNGQHYHLPTSRFLQLQGVCHLNQCCHVKSLQVIASMQRDWIVFYSLFLHHQNAQNLLAIKTSAILGFTSNRQRSILQAGRFGYFRHSYTVRFRIVTPPCGIENIAL